jgi:zinc protease
MDLLCTSLGQGESSRLYQRLVKDKKLVQDANFGLTATSGCGIASLDLTCEPEKIEAALAESKKVIEEIAKYGLEDHEIERVKNSLESEVVYGKEVFESYARRLGYYYCQFQDPSYEQEYLEALLRVDKEQIQKAMKMLVVETPQFSVIHPKGVSVSSEKILKVWEKPIVSFQYTEDPLKATPQKINLTQAPFIFKKAEHLPVLSAKFIFKGGSREETAENLGISNFFQKIWTSGTKKYNSFQIAHKLEALGASIHGFSGKNTLGLSVECLVKHWPIVKELFSEILLSPSFDEKEIEVEKELTLREVLTERDSPAALCQINFLETLYPNHSNGRSQLGTKESVQNFSREKLLKFYKDKITLDRLTISTVGALGLEEWKESLQEWEPNLKSGSTKVLPYQEINTPKAIQIITAKKEPLFQSQVMVGFLGNSIFDSERYALKLLSSCLSGQGGRLFLELRDKQSLAYSVSPIQSEGPEKGFFGVYIGCATEKLVKALQGIRIELEKILQTPLSNKELDRAKEYWLGRHDLDMQRFSSQAMVYGLDEVYGLGCDQSLKVADIIKGVTAKEIQAAAEKIIKLNSPVISIVHSSELVKEEVQQIWG